MSPEQIHDKLFQTNVSVYAVVDGAMLPALLVQLEEYKPKYACLLRGELPFDLAEAAPYLIKLNESNDLSKWLIEYSLKKPCCIFIHSKERLNSLRKHCRQLIKARLPDERIVHFRFYDPRVIPTFIDPNDQEAIDNIYGSKIEKILVILNKEIVTY